MKIENKKTSVSYKATVKRLLAYLGKGYKARFVLVIVLILISALAGVAGSLFLRLLIDQYITPMLTETAPSFAPLFRALLIMGSIYVAGILATLFYNWNMVTIAQGILMKIRDDMFSHMQELPIKYFDTNSHGDIMSHYTNDTDTLRQMFTQSLPQVFSSIVTITAVFFAMLYTSVYLTIVVLFCIAIMYIVTGRISGNSAKYFISQQMGLGKINGYIEEMINGQKVVKVFCHEEETVSKFNVLNEELCDHANLANRYANILMPVISNIGNLQYVLIAFTGGIMAVSGFGGITVGAIASFLQLSKTFSMPIGQVAQQLNAVVMALAGASRIFNLLDEIPEEDNGYVTLVNAKIEDGVIKEAKENSSADIWAWKQPQPDGSVIYTQLMGDVRFYNVDFSYQNNKQILYNVSLYAKPGQKVAFVGATGAGKTTITNLINRFYDITDGTITYDGIDIKDIKKNDLRRSLGIVLQDTNLFTGTIMENIKYGKLDATDEEVFAAAERVNADTFISMLPKGYDTVIAGDGSELSQGQRQLLSIARAAIHNPPVMIMDEATSSIDTRTEVIVQKGMDALMDGRTVFVIAHRLSTIYNSDVIIVLEQGRIIEKGNHEELIKNNGKYFQLYTGAFELN